MRKRGVLRAVLWVVFLFLFLGAEGWASSPAHFKAIPAKPVRVPRALVPPLKLKDIHLERGKGVVVVMESSKKSPSKRDLKEYSVRVGVKGSKPLTVNLGSPRRGAKVEVKGKEVLCSTGLPVKRISLVKAELLRKGAVVSSLTRTLNPMGSLMAKGATKPGAASVAAGITKPSKIPKVEIPNLPDLVVSSFEVGNVSTTRGAYVVYPVVVKIRNQGRAQAQAPFYIGLEYYKNKTGRWDHTGSEILVNTPLDPGREKTLNGEMAIFREDLSQGNVRVRAMVDAPYGEEFPTRGGLVQELNERNNYSAETMIRGAWSPEITSFYSDTIVRGQDNVIVYGYSLSPPSSNYVLVMEDSSGNRVPADVTSWGQNRITARVPEGVGTGQVAVYIGFVTGEGHVGKVSNSKYVMVLDRGEVSWDDVVGLFNLFSGAISVRLHTRSGSKYNNASEIILFANKVPLDVPEVEFSTSAGHYRYLVDDMNSDKVTADRVGCSDNQLRLVVHFESQGTELKGYWRDVAKVGGWRDGGAPDIEVNNANLAILFQFEPTRGGGLDYRAAVSFTASINASSGAADWLMDLFMGGWENKIKKNVVQGVRSAINSPEVKNQIIDALEGMVRFKVGMDKRQTITRWEFLRSGIRVTYY